MQATGLGRFGSRTTRPSDGSLGPMTPKDDHTAQFVPVTELSSTLARIVKGALEAEGIPVRLDREAISAVYGLETGRFATRLLVPADRLDEARALIDEVEAQD